MSDHGTHIYVCLRYGGTVDSRNLLKLCFTDECDGRRTLDIRNRFQICEYPVITVHIVNICPSNDTCIVVIGLISLRNQLYAVASSVLGFATAKICY